MPHKQSSADVTYHGRRRENGSAVIPIENSAGEQIGEVRHLPKHSPTGMNWGFTGSGPADTARSLLIDAMGPEAVCPTCRGTNSVVYVKASEGSITVPEPYDPERHRWTKRGWQCECDGGFKRTAYPAFTEIFVSQWDDEWLMDRATILDWLAVNRKLERASTCAPEIRNRL